MVRTRLWVCSALRASGGLAAATVPSATTVAASPNSHRRLARAVTPAPRSMASPSRTIGVALSVDRRASPAVVLVMNDLMIPPMAEGAA
jgi:hypothetical protein